jgi:CRISPR/Cas system-associated exonuclease Cas4 (RecB family)
VNRLQLTDYETARQVFQRYDDRAYKHGLYNAYLLWLKDNGPEYARQFVFFKTPEQLRIVGENILAQTKELINEGPHVYPNPNQMNCSSCSFQLPCFARQSGNDYTAELVESFVQTEPYYIQRRKQV